MAIVAENLDVILRVIGLRSFQAQMREARGSVAGIGKAAKESDAAAASTAGKSEKYAAATRKAALGIAGVLAVTAGESYKMSIEYQREVEMIHTQAGATQSETNHMYNSILSMTKQFPQGPIQMAQAMYHLESVGIRGSAALDALRKSAELAAVGNAHLEDTTSAVGAVWRAYHGTGVSFNEIVSTLNATVGAGNMRMNDLVAALGTGVLPVFKTGALTIQDFGGALALLTDEGQHADNAATHLRMAVNLLAAPSKIAQKELHGIGLHAFDLADKMKGPNGLVNALKLLRDHLYQTFPGQNVPIDRMKQLLINPNDLAGLTHAQSERMNVLSRAFGGARSGATIMALVDQLDGVQQKITQVQTHAKNFGDSVSHTMGLPAVKLHTAWSSLQVEMIHFGDAIRGPVTSALVGLVGVATSVVSGLVWMTHHGKLLRDILVPLALAFVSYKLALLATWGAEKLVMAAEFIKFWYDFIRAVGLAETAMVAMDVAMDANPIGILALAIAGLIIGIYELIKHWNSVKKAAKAFFDFLLHSPWAYAAGAIFGPIGLGVVFTIRHFKQIESVFKAVWDFMKSHSAAAGRWLAAPFKYLWAEFKPIWTGIKSVFSSVWKFIKHNLEDWWNKIEAIINAVKKLISWIGKIHFPHISLPHIGLPHISMPHIGAPSIPGVPFPGYAEGVEGFQGGFALINERARGERVYLPRGTSVQPSPASSMRLPRSHTPNPAPQSDVPPIIVHHETKLDSKVLYTSVTKYFADRQARA